MAIKQLDRNALNKDFLVEVQKLCLLHHQNLANLIGYCADGDQRLLVYEFVPLGSLETHLLGKHQKLLIYVCLFLYMLFLCRADLPSDRKPLNWHARIKIAYGTAQGLEYLHEKAKPPVIYRDLKSSNILLDEDFTPRLSDFGLSRLGQMGELMGSYGYSAPEYSSSGQLTVKSDVYSFGVLILELITGRRVMDTTKPTQEQNLVSWVCIHPSSLCRRPMNELRFHLLLLQAMPMFRDQKRYPELIDPLLDGDFNLKELNQLVAVAAMCLQEESTVRPIMTDVVMTLSFLTTGPSPTSHNPPPAEDY